LAQALLREVRGLVPQVPVLTLEHQGHARRIPPRRSQASTLPREVLALPGLVVSLGLREALKRPSPTDLEVSIPRSVSFLARHVGRRADTDRDAVGLTGGVHRPYLGELLRLGEHVAHARRTAAARIAPSSGPWPIRRSRASGLNFSASAWILSKRS